MSSWLLPVRWSSSLCPGVEHKSQNGIEGEIHGCARAGGPQNKQLPTLSLSMRLLRSIPSPSRCSCPIRSSRCRGRTRSGKGRAASRFEVVVLAFDVEATGARRGLFDVGAEARAGGGGRPRDGDEEGGASDPGFRLLTDVSGSVVRNLASPFGPDESIADTCPFVGIEELEAAEVETNALQDESMWALMKVSGTS